MNEEENRKRQKTLEWKDWKEKEEERKPKLQSYLEDSSKDQIRNKAQLLGYFKEPFREIGEDIH